VSLAVQVLQAVAGRLKCVIRTTRLNFSNPIISLHLLTELLT